MARMASRTAKQAHHHIAATLAETRPLNHQERQVLIQKPFGMSFRVPGKTWGGMLVRHPDVDARGGRVFASNTLDDTPLTPWDDDLES